ncbi:MAG TPA: 16S rRNA (uracil(1498)-N(3))-methyltransferase [Bacteroidales bacterium]|nr:16S rRNA (uracil(1498)-N(3))-methyltransferase [Bacteroidales bacterium]
MQLFYSNNITIDNTGSLQTTESLHCIRVLRHKTGDMIYVTDGKGKLFHAQITDYKPGECKFQIISQHTGSGKRNYYNHIAIAPTKNIDRMEWFVEKAVEIGIDEISFLKCRYSERKHINIDRITRIAESAMKQSLNTYLPKINELSDYSNFITHYHSKAKCIAICSETPVSYVTDIITAKEQSLVLIGPEGDFSNEEIQLALSHQYKPVSLGHNRLRTETAGIVTCQILASLNY